MFTLLPSSTHPPCAGPQYSSASGLPSPSTAAGTRVSPPDLHTPGQYRQQLLPDPAQEFPSAAGSLTSPSGSVRRALPHYVNHISCRRRHHHLPRHTSLRQHRLHTTTIRRPLVIVGKAPEATPSRSYSRDSSSSFTKQQQLHQITAASPSNSSFTKH